MTKTYKAEAIKLPYGWTSFVTTWIDGEKVKSEPTEVLTGTKDEAIEFAENVIKIREYWNGSISGQLKNKSVRETNRKVLDNFFSKL